MTSFAIFVIIRKPSFAATQSRCFGLPESSEIVLETPSKHKSVSIPMYAIAADFVDSCGTLLNPIHRHLHLYVSFYISDIFRESVVNILRGTRAWLKNKHERLSSVRITAPIQVRIGRFGF